MGKSMACVRSFGGVGIYNPCAAFVVLMGTPTGAGSVPPPKAEPLRQGEKTPKKRRRERYE